MFPASTPTTWETLGSQAVRDPWHLGVPGKNFGRASDEIANSLQRVMMIEHLWAYRILLCD